MGFFSTLEVAAAALDVQQRRLEVIATNLANVDTTAPPGQPPFSPSVATVTSVTDANGLPRPVLSSIDALDLAPRRRYEPGHPDADTTGFVILPGTDPVGWTLDLLQISRTYEANLRAFDITRNLVLRTLDLGNRR